MVVGDAKQQDHPVVETRYAVEIPRLSGLARWGCESVAYRSESN
ncbi:hypothetical protein C8E97_3614 [Saccharothrix australiensis]|uniref:Uncharacterized protein n=1 Tax=Saccharothrix australiensis TaxID=2072 RepID=A0A495VZU5_9PSEU|nr:hypothetical protein C8E97_3614 [Saccharothrix australiensis]